MLDKPKKRKSKFDARQSVLFMPESPWVRPAEPPNLAAAKEIAFDVETKDERLARDKGPGWFAPGMGYILGVSLAWEGGSCYLPIAHPRSDNFDKDAVGRYLKALFARRDARFIAHNASYDVGWIKREWGIEPPTNLDDTMAMAALVDEDRLSYALDDLCAWQKITGKDEALLIEAAEALRLYGNKDIKSNLNAFEARYVGRYAEQDTVSTLELYKSLLPILKQEETYDAYRLEADLIPMTVEMRRRGIRVDLEAADRAQHDLHARAEKIVRDIEAQTGFHNHKPLTMKAIRSPIWLKDTFTRFGIPFPHTKLGHASFEADWMKKSEHPLPKMIVAARKYTEAAEKFLKSYIIDYAHNGRIHATINQFQSEDGGTRSHRMSYADPPLQQTPSRDDEIAPLIRGVFLPEPGELWCACDYSQQEFRLIVNVAETYERLPPEVKYTLAAMTGKNPHVAGAIETADEYRRNPSVDFHDWVANITHLPRRRAKDVNFAKAFGAGITQFASMTGMSEGEAAATMDQYDQRLPFVFQSARLTQGLANARGWIRLIDGARCHYNKWDGGDWTAEGIARYRALGGKDGTGPTTYEHALARVSDPIHPWQGPIRRAFTHKAYNHLIQGSAARQMKRAMLLCWGEKIVPLIQMHDELSMSVASPDVGPRAAALMRFAVKTDIPMKVDVEYGPSWGTAKEPSWETAKNKLPKGDFEP